MLVAIATSFRRFDDVTGDPEAITRAQIKAATAKTFDALRAAHVADHQKLFRRVAFDCRRRRPRRSPPTSASAIRRPATTRSSPRCTFNTAATC